MRRKKGRGRLIILSFLSGKSPSGPLFVILWAVLFGTSLSSISFAASADGIASRTRQEMNNTRIVGLINTYRVQNGLTLLRQNPRLGVSTSLKVKDMVRQSYFAHTNPEGLPFSNNVRKARYDYRSVAEVLAKGCRSEAQVLTLWSKSPTHNDALLDPAFRDVNCSSSFSHGVSYVACHLARPRMLAVSSWRRPYNRP